jgi:chromosomal replication initiation ATPase DnaA
MAAIVSTQPIVGIGTSAQKPEAPALLPLDGRLPGRIFVRGVIRVTADHFGTTVPELLSRRRWQPLCRRRQVAMYVAREMTGRSFPFIGSKIGARHHTTILHGVRTVKGLLAAGDAEMVAAVEAIMERLRVLRTGRARS